MDGKLREWHDLIAKISIVNLLKGTDTFKGYLHKNRTFTVWSMYVHLLEHLTQFHHKLIWKLKIPLKINFFLWFLENE